MKKTRKDKGKKHRKFRKKNVMVYHHISYNPEFKVKIFQGEHMILTRLQWRKKISDGFITALNDWIKQNYKKAVDLESKE